MKMDLENYKFVSEDEYEKRERKMDKLLAKRDVKDEKEVVE